MRINPINQPSLIRKTKTDRDLNSNLTRQNHSTDSVSFGHNLNQSQLFDRIAFINAYRHEPKATKSQMEALMDIYRSCKANVIPSVEEVVAEIRKDLEEKGIANDIIPRPFSCNRLHLIEHIEFNRHIYVDDEGLIHANDVYFDSQINMGPAHANSKNWLKVEIFKHDKTNPVEKTTLLPNGEVIFESKHPQTIFWFDRNIFPCIIRRLTGFSNYTKASELRCETNGHISYSPNPKIELSRLPIPQKSS